MAEKILYYLGAGASANALPVASDVVNAGKVDIKGLPRGLEELHQTLRKPGMAEPGWLVTRSNLFDECRSLAYSGREFGNVDTYAKFLYLQGEKDALRNLKRTLAFYFGMEQLVNKARDNRYLPWLISILDEKLFPENVKILSWNYDFQIQLAAMNFKVEEIGESSGGALMKSIPLVAYYPGIDLAERKPHEVNLVHLNGIAGFFQDPAGLRKHIYLPEYVGDIEKFFDAVKEQDLSEGIHFAWEKNGYHQSLLNEIHKLIKDTTILVVIGYSFPFFNREVDKAVFDQLKRSSSFKKVYFQDPKLNGEQLIAQFGLDPKIVIKHISQVENFHIPFEY
jgi:hypothetical protein